MQIAIVRLVDERLTSNVYRGPLRAVSRRFSSGISRITQSFLWVLDGRDKLTIASASTVLPFNQMQLRFDPVMLTSYLP